MAASAREMSASGDCASSGKVATPRLAVMRMGPNDVSLRKGIAAISVRIRFAASTAWSRLARVSIVG